MRGTTIRHALSRRLLSSVGVAALVGVGLSFTPAKTLAAEAGSASATIDEIVVTAQRREQAISQVPVSVQAISAQQIERGGSQSTMALVQMSPSVSFRASYSINASGFTIRGVSSIAIEGGLQPSTGLIIDGMPAYRAGEFITDLADIERLEILRGPQGTLFGKNATAGVINIVTKTPVDHFEASAEAGATNDSEYWVRGMANAPLGQGLALRVNGYYRDQSPLIDNRGTGNNTLGEESYGVQAKVAADLSPGLRAVLTAAYSHHESSYGDSFVIVPDDNDASGVPSGLGVLQRAVSGLTYGYGNHSQNKNGFTGDVFTTHSVVAELTGDVSDKLKVTSVTGYRRFYADNAGDFDEMPTGFQPGGFAPNPLHWPFLFQDTGLPRTPEVNSYGSQEFRLNYAGERADIVAGVFAQFIKSRGEIATTVFTDNTIFGLPGVFGIALWTHNQWTVLDNTYAAFGDMTYKLTDSLSMFGGLRYTKEKIKETYSRDDRTGLFAGQFDPLTGNPLTPPASVTAFTAKDDEGEWSGRLGVQWRPAEGHNFYASYNRGYKGPAADTSRLASGPDPVNKPGYRPITAPEIATAFEVGAKQRLLAGRLVTSLAIYDMKIEGIQQTSLIPGTQLSVLVNAGDLRSKGVEFETQFALSSEWRFGGGFAYTDATYENAPLFACATFQTAAQGCVNGLQDINGKPAISSPKWKYNLSAEYRHQFNAIPASLSVNVNWTWSDKIQFSVSEDPLTIERRHAFLNASATLASDDGHWEGTIFGRNLTDEFYYNTVLSAPPVIGNSFGYLSRDFKAYGGVSVRYKY